MSETRKRRHIHRTILPIKAIYGLTALSIVPTSFTKGKNYAHRTFMPPHTRRKHLREPHSRTLRKSVHLNKSIRIPAFRRIPEYF